MISIHAPLTGSDQAPLPLGYLSINFNPRSPYGERPLPSLLNKHRTPISIHAPLTGSDRVSHYITCPFGDFNPRSPYGERRDHSFQRPWPLYFNPRSPYGERHAKRRDLLSVLLFQSTLPLRGATHRKAPLGHWYNHFNPRSPYGERHFKQLERLNKNMISIHAPLTGSDSNDN